MGVGRAFFGVRLTRSLGSGQSCSVFSGSKWSQNFFVGTSAFVGYKSIRCRAEVGGKGAKASSLSRSKACASRLHQPWSSWH